MTMPQKAFCWSSGYAAYNFHLIFIWILRLCPHISNTATVLRLCMCSFFKMFLAESAYFVFCRGPTFHVEFKYERKTNKYVPAPHPPFSAGKAKRNQKKPVHYLHCAFSKWKKVFNYADYQWAGYFSSELFFHTTSWFLSRLGQVTLVTKDRDKMRNTKEHSREICYDLIILPLEQLNSKLNASVSLQQQF